MARGNGKSTFTAAIATGAILAGIVPNRAEVVIAAAGFRQAKIIFDHIAAFLAPVIAADRKQWRIYDSAAQAWIKHRPTGVVIHAIGGRPQTAHGRAPWLTLCDEPAQWKHGDGTKLYNALKTASGKIPGARLLALGTKPDKEEHFFSQILKAETSDTYAQIHTADPKAALTDRKQWRKANPSFNKLPSLRAAIAANAQGALIDPVAAAAFKAYRLNLGTAELNAQELIDGTVWRRITRERKAADRSGAVVWGVDVGTTAAMSAVAAYWPETGRLEVLAAFPTQPALSVRGERDGVGDLYERMAARGELITCGGQHVNLAALMACALNQFGAPAVIAADRWRWGELADSLNAANVPTAEMESRGQGFRDGGEDVRAFRKAVLIGQVKPLPSLLLTAAIAEARVVSDPAGNAKLAKSSEGERRARHRDDAAAAAILAVAAGMRKAGWPDESEPETEPLPGQVAVRKKRPAYRTTRIV